MLRLIILCLVFGISGCASKSSSDIKSSSPSQPTDPVEALKGFTDSSDPSTPKKIYFADLQILVQTNPESTCPESQKLEDGRSEEYTVEINQAGELVRKLGPKTAQYYALNVNFQKMGFDTASFKFSALDGVVPVWAPHQLRIRRRPGNFIELFYLTEIFKLQLSQTQVYSFKAIEKRGSCTIQHDINIFAENVGYYPPAPPDSAPLN